eukprot:jgi/Ulvmu1/954/UM102_0037.1
MVASYQLCSVCLRPLAGPRGRAPAVTHASRRDVSIAAPVAAILSVLEPERARAAQNIPPARFVAGDGKFTFEYPDRWAVAIDRSSMKVPGVLVVAGDFPNNITLNVSREKLSSLTLNDTFSQSQLSTADGRQKFLEGAIASKTGQDSMFEFAVLSSTFREEQDGRVYLELEFKESTCKGDVIEGLRGRRRCVDAFDNTISTPEKHAFQVATVGQDGYVYTATGGTLEPKFAAVADALKQAARTFRVA